MMPLATLIPYFAASALLALAPGPDNIFLLTQSALRGKRAGLIIMLGLCTGLIGAAYLAYLAWGAFRAGPETIQAAAGPELGFSRLYRRGIIMNVTNPKVSIFFLAFLPQFTDPARGPVWIQLLVLGGFFILATFFVFGAIAILAGTLGFFLNRSRRAQSILQKAAGAVFLGLALKLAFFSR